VELSDGDCKWLGIERYRAGAGTKKKGTAPMVKFPKQSVRKPNE
jgi:hypothetical protein